MAEFEIKAGQSTRKKSIILKDSFLNQKGKKVSSEEEGRKVTCNGKKFFEFFT